MQGVLDFLLEISIDLSLTPTPTPAPAPAPTTAPTSTASSGTGTGTDMESETGPGNGTGTGTGDGFFIPPTILVDVPVTSRIWMEEIFGPVLCVNVSKSLYVSYTRSHRQSICHVRTQEYNISLCLYLSVCFLSTSHKHADTLSFSFYYTHSLSLFLSFLLSLKLPQSFTTEEEAVRVANDSTYGLAAAIFSADSVRCNRVVRKMRAGVVWQNCSQVR